MLFHPGFSTAPLKTELAGRGVGLDVVRANLNSLNGEIEIQSTAGAGTKFILKAYLSTRLMYLARYSRALRDRESRCHSRLLERFARSDADED